MNDRRGNADEAGDGVDAIIEGKGTILASWKSAGIWSALSAGGLAESPELLNSRMSVTGDQATMARRDIQLIWNSRRILSRVDGLR